MPPPAAPTQINKVSGKAAPQVKFMLKIAENAATKVMAATPRMRSNSMLPKTAARFSFLLSAPIMMGAGLKSLLDIRGELATGAMVKSDLLYFATGFVAAAVSGYLCVKFLLRFLQKNSTDAFVFYRWLLAILVLILALVRS